MADSPLTIRKLDTSGAVVISYTGTLVRETTEEVVVRAIWTLPTRDLGYVVFETGDVFIEYYYTNRWYNVFAIYSGRDHALKGWYCNMSRPAICLPGELHWLDLLLDLFVKPDWSGQVLDEDELAADPTLDAATKAHVQETLKELLLAVARRESPFDDDPAGLEQLKG